MTPSGWRPTWPSGRRAWSTRRQGPPSPETHRPFRNGRSAVAAHGGRPAIARRTDEDHRPESEHVLLRTDGPRPSRPGRMRSWRSRSSASRSTQFDLGSGNVGQTDRSRAPETAITGRRFDRRSTPASSTPSTGPSRSTTSYSKNPNRSLKRCCGPTSPFDLQLPSIADDRTAGVDFERDDQGVRARLQLS